MFLDYQLHMCTPSWRPKKASIRPSQHYGPHTNCRQIPLLRIFSNIAPFQIRSSRPILGRIYPQRISFLRWFLQDSSRHICAPALLSSPPLPSICIAELTFHSLSILSFRWLRGCRIHSTDCKRLMYRRICAHTPPGRSALARVYQSDKDIPRTRHLHELCEFKGPAEGSKA